MLEYKTGYNLHLLLSADIVSGQFRSPDMIAVDLVSELHKVPSPDRFTFDSPPAKAANRYAALLVEKNNKTINTRQ